MVLLGSGCGYREAQKNYRLRGWVLERDSKEPVDGAYIDVADKREYLDYFRHTKTLTDKDGGYDYTFTYNYEKGLLLFIPWFWVPSSPERIYIEAVKNDYERAIMELPASRLQCLEENPTSINKIAPIEMEREAR